MPTKIDEFDFAILTYLQVDGRMSLSDLADKMDVSVNTIRNRINYLIEKKVLTIVGRVDINLVGFEFYVQLRIKVRPVNKIDQIAEILAGLDETSFVALCSGSFDLEINIMCVNKEHLLKTIKKIHEIEGVEECIKSDYFKVYKTGQPELSLIKKYS